MDRDAIDLFDQDRHRWLAICRDFFENPRIPLDVKGDAARDTAKVMLQLLAMASPRGEG